MQLYKQVRYKNYNRIEYDTVKLEDVINFFESEKFKEWLDKNTNIPTKLNPSITYGQAYRIFYNSSLSRKQREYEFMDSLGFKNFKKLWGKQIKYIKAK